MPGGTILLADDHTIFREALRELLTSDDFSIVGDACDGAQAVEMARKLRPDVAVLDVAMPFLNGVDAAREMRTASPETRVILLTVHSESQFVLAGLEAGAKGYVLKTQAVDELERAIRAVLRGERFLSPGVSGAVMDAYLSSPAAPPMPLTGRERQVLQLIAEGRTTRAIAEVLGVSVKTAESHRTRIMKKIEVHETAGLVRYAIRNGIVQA